MTPSTMWAGLFALVFTVAVTVVADAATASVAGVDELAAMVESPR